MKAQFILSLLALICISCGKKDDMHNENVIINEISEHTSVSIISSKLAVNLKSTIDSQNNICEDQVREVTCISASQESGFDKNCLKEGVSEAMLSTLLNIVNDLPEFHQKVFCNLARIQIHTNINSLGYASQIKDEEYNIIGSMFGMRIDFLTNKLNKNIETWKEQLNFGLSTKDDPQYKISAKGPKINSGIVKYKNSLLLELVIHELSHIIDMLNSVTLRTEYKLPYDNIRATSTSASFNSLSWPMEIYYKVGQDEWPTQYWAMYPLLIRKCYYYCDNSQILPVSSMNDLYEELKDSSFLTSYSSTSEREDFAETSMVVLLADKGFYYQIKGADDRIIFEAKEQIKKQKLQRKINWIKNFYTRTDLKYN